jgi:hypothetical protein
MEQDLRKFLNEMVAKYGSNQTTLAISKIVDKYDTEAQRRELERCLNKLQKIMM